MDPESGESSRRILIELDYTHFVTPVGWMHVIQVVCGLLAICCTGAAAFPTQIYFIVVIVIVFVGSILLSLAHLKNTEFSCYGKVVEFAYTSVMAFFCFTAFVAQVSDLGAFELEGFGHRWIAQIVAGVFGSLCDLALCCSVFLQFSEAKQSYYEIQDNKT